MDDGKSEGSDFIRKLFENRYDDINDHILEWERFSVEQLFNVSGVSVKTEPIRTRVGEVRIGASVSTKLSGYRDTMTISVESNESPVKTLKFLGSHPIFAGDEIRAYIAAAERYNIYVEESSVYDDEKRAAYRQRELGELEIPFKIEKLSHGDVIGTYENPVSIQSRSSF